MITLHGVANILGVIGVISILYAYLMLQLGKMRHHGIWYSLLNTVGSFLILYSLFFFWNLPSFIIEIVWLLISTYGLIKAFWTRKNGSDVTREIH